MISKGWIMAGVGAVLGIASLTVFLVYSPSKEEIKEIPVLKNDEKQEVEQRIEEPVQESADDRREEPEILESENKNYTMDLFANLPDNSIGSKFQDSLLGSSEDISSWNKKLEIWKLNINERKNHEPFIHTSTKLSPDIDSLWKRCKNKYRMKSWNEVKSDITRNKLKKDQYMSMIWTYCGKQDRAMPDNWLTSLG